jgi:hypothetical protein
LEKEILYWQHQRLVRVNRLIEEYNEKGWFLPETADCMKETIVGVEDSINPESHNIKAF